MRRIVLAGAAFGLMAGTMAAARTAQRPATPDQVARLFACGSVADTAQRLACFERETASFNQALARRDLVVIDRQSSTAARKSLFGFSVPSLGGLFGGDENEIKEMDGVVAAASSNGQYGWAMRLVDGSSWSQTDDVTIALPPRKGDKVKIRRRSLGSFTLSVNGQPGVKVRRTG